MIAYLFGTTSCDLCVIGQHCVNGHDVLIKDGRRSNGKGINPRSPREIQADKLGIGEG